MKDAELKEAFYTTDDIVYRNIYKNELLDRGTLSDAEVAQMQYWYTLKQLQTTGRTKAIQQATRKYYRDYVLKEGQEFKEEEYRAWAQANDLIPVEAMIDESKQGAMLMPVDQTYSSSVSGNGTRVVRLEISDKNATKTVDSIDLNAVQFSGQTTVNVQNTNGNYAIAQVTGTV